MAVPNKGQSSQEGVSGDKLLKKTGFLGNISTEETWLLMYIRLYSTRDNLVYGLYQNPTYNKMWIRPLGKSGGEGSVVLVSSEPAESNLCGQGRRKGKVIGVTLTSALKGISTPHQFQSCITPGTSG